MHIFPEMTTCKRYSDKTKYMHFMQEDQQKNYKIFDSLGKS